MSNEKMYTPQEVARIILKKTHDTLKKHELLIKANSSHELESGSEPKNDEAECPESLKGEGSSCKTESSEYSEDSSMEDEPLSDYEDESEEDEEDEEEKEEESKYEFRKSESGMYNIQYKRIIGKN